MHDITGIFCTGRTDRKMADLAATGVPTGGDPSNRSAKEQSLDTWVRDLAAVVG